MQHKFRTRARKIHNGIKAQQRSNNNNKNKSNGKNHYVFVFCVSNHFAIETRNEGNINDTQMADGII